MIHNINYHWMSCLDVYGNEMEVIVNTNQIAAIEAFGGGFNKWA